MVRIAMPLVVWISLLSIAQAAEPKPQGKHVKAGVTCHDCHREEHPTQGAVADDSCMVCHGDYPAMAAYTRNLPVNPHAVPKAGHPGPFGCTECHCQHKPPVVKCLECHPKFKMISK
jgi:hypothetical protein